MKARPKAKSKSKAKAKKLCALKALKKPSARSSVVAQSLPSGPEEDDPRAGSCEFRG